MKRLTALISFALVAFFATPSTSSAAVTYQQGLSGFDSEVIAGSTSYYWEASVFVQDDADGFISINWYTYDGPKFAIYSVSANADTWTLFAGEDASGTAAQAAIEALVHP